MADRFRKASASHGPISMKQKKQMIKKQVQIAENIQFNGISCLLFTQVHLNAVRSFNSVPGNFQFGSRVPNGTAAPAAAPPKSILKKRSTESNIRDRP